MEGLLSFQFLAYTLLLFLIHLPPLSSLENQWFGSCGKSFNCGNLTGITYPFWGNDRRKECGYPGFELQCDDQGSTILQISNVNYLVLDIKMDAQIITVTRKDLAEGICQFNTTMDSNIFEYALSLVNVTVNYVCPPWAGNTGIAPSAGFNCAINGMSYKNDLDGVGTCHASIVIPARKEYSSGGTIGNLGDLKQLLKQGFDLRWKVDTSPCKECEKFGGSCGFDADAKQFTCLCPNHQSSSSSSSNACTSGIPAAGAGSPGTGKSSPLSFTPSESRKKNQTPLAIGLGVGGAVLAGIGIGWLIFFCRQKRKRIAAQASPVQAEKKDLPVLSSSNGLTTSSPNSSTTFTRSIPSYPSSTSEADYGRGSSYFGAHVFSFAELEEATDNFDQSKELGDGGFGVVYYGKLRDGRVVAVKRLYENNFKRVEQFMNEVEILTKLRHQHLVTLYGCTSKRSRDLLLVYEYISNGTVADHLHGNRAKSGLLSWPVRMNIAIETADALAYLHSSVIIHRDVKTNNILLDNDFHVKVADFGLSRLFPDNVTHVSTAPQGTPGYVDPEYYQCYQLTEKSDVYSFGVVLIELISSLQAVDTNRHRHDINLANMAVNKIQTHSVHELVDPSLGFTTNSSVRRMTTLVAELAFRCLQQERDMRPSMREVLETLRGIQNGESNAHKAEVLDIVVDDVGLLKGSGSPSSPHSSG
ncbi:LEAF RUST 10 DISEASE-RESISTANCEUS RECEPTOR-LIKE PROTEIN KINASE-like 1.4 isoform X1 [Nicotiana tomentosiformis]|uniref:LEAF RUST 10 DISEASE-RESISTANCEUS RECEPTOR-LIKE PROTEIN KINASE-like 1.4 isoform X1 n=1 Tax=Nicotiana tomentosiformis TaxID=4098 RepID=UPI00051B6C58|nr:LEAF RUST 10 DISEASE-RESISTANCE LOCUS RECEPTOR-LIKE PROTEIN KINASE-like 1.4 isoform X1 [Nicotiana tomentosiformis]